MILNILSIKKHAFTYRTKLIFHLQDKHNKQKNVTPTKKAYYSLVSVDRFIQGPVRLVSGKRHGINYVFKEIIPYVKL